MRLTCLDNNIVSRLLDRGLLQCLAIVMADNSYSQFYEKVAQILSNIACDAPDRLVASEACDAIIDYGQHGSLQFRWNLVSMINNLMGNLRPEAAVVVERRDPRIMACLVDGLNILKNNSEMTLEILQTVDLLFKSDILVMSAAYNAEGRNLVIERFLAFGGDERLTQLQTHPNMDIYLMQNELRQQISTYERILQEDGMRINIPQRKISPR